MRNFKDVTKSERDKILQEKKNNPFIKTSYLSKKYSLYETTLNDFFKKNHCTTKELTGLRYRKYSVNDNYFNKIVHPNIRRCLNGITKKAYGYTWRELEEGEEENYEQYICN